MGGGGKRNGKALNAQTSHVPEAEVNVVPASIISLEAVKSRAAESTMAAICPLILPFIYDGSVRSRVPKNDKISTYKWTKSVNDKISVTNVPTLTAAIKW